MYVAILCSPTALLYLHADPIAPTATVEPRSPTEARITWVYPFEVSRYEVLFERATTPAEQQGICLSSHTDSVSVNGDAAEYTLTGLEEYSTYTISVTAVIKNGLTSLPSIQQVTTLQAGRIRLALHPCPLNDYLPSSPFWTLNDYLPSSPIWTLNDYLSSSPICPLNDYLSSSPICPLNDYLPSSPICPLNDYLPSNPSGH